MRGGLSSGCESCASRRLLSKSRSAVLRRRSLYALLRRDDRRDELALLLLLFADIDILDGVVRHRIETEGEIDEIITVEIEK